MSSGRKSILCPNCRKLISVDEPVCPYCGLIRPGLHNTAGIIRKIFLGSDPVRTIIYVNIALYVLSLILVRRNFAGRFFQLPFAIKPKSFFIRSKRHYPCYRSSSLLDFNFRFVSARWDTAYRLQHDGAISAWPLRSQGIRLSSFY